MRYIKGISVTEINVEGAPESRIQQESLNLRGQRQPIRLWQYAAKDNKEFKYRIVDGRRRIADLIALNQKNKGDEFDLSEVTVDALVYLVNELDEENMRLDALTLNSGSSNEMDEAEHINYLIQELGYSVEDVALAVNFSVTTVINRLDIKHRLLPEYQEALREGQLKVTAAYNLNQIEKEEQKTLYDKEMFTIKQVQKGVKKIRDAKKHIGNETLPLPTEQPQPKEVVVEKEEEQEEHFDLNIPFEMLENGGGIIHYMGKQYTVTFEEWKPNEIE